MIAFLPELYSDELVYSWLSRYYVKSGCLSFAYVVEDLYVHQYTRPDIEFLNEMKLDVMELIDRYCNIEQLVQRHTMFSSYGRFLPLERKQEAYEALLRMHGNFHAHKVNCELYSCQSGEYVRQSINPARCKVIRHCEHNVRNYEKHSSEQYIRIGFEPLF